VGRKPKERGGRSEGSSGEKGNERGKSSITRSVFDLAGGRKGIEEKGKASEERFDGSFRLRGEKKKKFRPRNPVTLSYSSRE